MPKETGKPEDLEREAESTDADELGLRDLEDQAPAMDEPGVESERAVAGLQRGSAAQPGAEDEDEREAEDLFDPARLDGAEKRALLSVLLFASGEVVPQERLSEFLGLDAAALDLLAEETSGELRTHGLDILRVAGGWRMVTAAQWDASLSRFFRQVRRGKLGKSALEILAVIAYEQPVSRSRVDELRQVNSESTLRSLLDKRLITVAGRAETPGRPFLYRTTARFLEVFGLDSLADLPPRPASLDLPVLPAEERESAPGLDDLPGFDEDKLDE